ncbi:hypothetical protein BT69DRAFT_552238 [Atractiella rhizophila]|nr:hypothetical protein BT69DRAFT_552238 [Atractiella rhizophila]
MSRSNLLAFSSQNHNMALPFSPLTTAPPFIEPSDSSSTPESFSSLPPVLEHSSPSVHISFALPSSTAEVAATDTQKEWNGTLYLTHAAFSLFEPEKAEGFSLPWSAITLHAMDKSSVYCQLSQSTPDSDMQDEEGEEDMEFAEMWIRLRAEESEEEKEKELQRIFDALSACASKQPADGRRAEEMFGGFGEGGWITGDNAVVDVDGAEDPFEDAEEGGGGGREERRYKPY